MNLLYEPPELPPTAWSTQLAPTPDADVGPWIERQVAGTAVKKLSMLSTQTARGWDLNIQSFDVDGGIVVIAVYQFFDLFGAIAIGGLEMGWLRAHDLEVAAALRAVEPDWISAEPLAVRDLWSEPIV